MQPFWIPHNIGTFTPLSQISTNIWSAVNKETQELVVIYIIPKLVHDSNQVFKITSEVKILKNNSHPYFVQFRDFIEDRKYYYIVVTNPKGQQLKTFIEANGPVPEMKAKAFFLSILPIIQNMDKSIYLKQANITHSNIYVSQNLGLCNITPNINLETNSDILFQAPETILGKYDRNLSKVWELGVFLYLIVVGKLPFSGSSMEEIKKNIMNETLKIPSTLSLPLQDLLKKMLTKNLMTRITFNQVLVHSWLKRLVKSKETITAGNIKIHLIGSNNDFALQTENKNIIENFPPGTPSVIKQRKHSPIKITPTRRVNSLSPKHIL